MKRLWYNSTTLPTSMIFSAGTLQEQKAEKYEVLTELIRG